jgi:hypothetical protein
MKAQYDNERVVELSAVRKGEYVKLLRKGIPTNKTYTKAEYVRGERKYQLDDHDDIWGNGRLCSGRTKVLVGFTY